MLHILEFILREKYHIYSGRGFTPGPEILFFIEKKVFKKTPVSPRTLCARTTLN
jgi:hypothetical protein